jgi:2-haloacid dehalogenase
LKALFFDVFGTLVDWHTGVARESERLLKPLGHSLDWLAFSAAWRDEYQPAMEEVRSGRTAFVRLDVIHRRMLERIVPKFKLEDVPEAVRAELVLSWHRLDAWKDVRPGLERLAKKFILAPVSNGNILLMVDLARRNGLPWDAILGAEIANDYKPKPRVYLSAVEALALRPDECVMVAAHSYDLKAAAGCGLKTAHVARPGERGPGTGESAPLFPMDFAVKSLEELAEKLV